MSLARTKVLAELQRVGPPGRASWPPSSGSRRGRSPTVVDTLERDGLAARQPDPTDRRALLVALTSEGEAALAVARATRERLLQQVFGALEPDGPGDDGAPARPPDDAIAELITGDADRLRRTRVPHVSIAPRGPAAAGRTTTAG